MIFPVFGPVLIAGEMDELRVSAWIAVAIWPPPNHPAAGEGSVLIGSLAEH